MCPRIEDLWALHDEKESALPGSGLFTPANTQGRAFDAPAKRQATGLLVSVTAAHF